MHGDSGFNVGCLIMPVILIYGLAQIFAGFIGIEYHLGFGWAVGAILAAFIVRFMLPLTIGAFFCALDVWGWHWVGALLFAAPGLAFIALMIPGMLASLFSSSSKRTQ